MGFAQKQSLDKQLFEAYDDFREISLDTRRFKHQDIQPLIGRSIQGRNISMISVGEGETQILLWSQMHGDESTATSSVFDMINYLKTDKTILKNEKKIKPTFVLERLENILEK